jgi:hypothetical protein
MRSMPMPRISEFGEWRSRYGPRYPCGHARSTKNSYANRRPRTGWRCKKCSRRNNSPSNPTVRLYNLRPDVRKSNTARVARYNRELRIAMISAYGGCCTCCGESTYEFMTLEHVHGGGNAERKGIGNGRNSGSSQMTIIRRLKNSGWPKGDYTVLCANCNMGTKYGRTCPHQQARQ